MIFYQHTPTYTLGKMGEKEQTKICIWPLRGASKVPQDIGICGFLPKLRFLAKFNIRLHNIQGSERPDFLSTHPHIYPKQDGRKRTNQNFHLAPQGGVNSAPNIGICQFLPKSRFLAKFNIRLHNIQGSERPDFLSTHIHIHP